MIFKVILERHRARWLGYSQKSQKAADYQRSEKKCGSNAAEDLAVLIETGLWRWTGWLVNPCCQSILSG